MNDTKLTLKQHLNWALTCLAGVLSGGRYAIRGYNSRRLYWDDLIHLLALVILIVHGGTNELSLNGKATLAKTAARKASQAELLGVYRHNQRVNTVNNCFLFPVFWIIKISFLLLYRLLFQSSPTFKKVWWAVTIFTLLTFSVPIAGVVSTCDDAQTVTEFSKLPTERLHLPYGTED